jgi:hypothetical protein
VPENRTVKINPASRKTAVSETIEATSVLKGSKLKRYATPGAIRWSRNIGSPTTFLRWSPLAGLVVSAGREVHNVTSRGDHRWQYVAGNNHRLYTLGDSEVVWSPDFQRLSQLLRGGRTGWTRDWAGKLVSDRQGNIYLLDAGTITSIAPDGTDKWRASPAGIREVEGPFSCSDHVLFQGMRGMQRVAIQISNRGSITRVTKLARGALLIGAGANCEPFVWRSGEVALLDAMGNAIWRRPFKDPPFVEALVGGFALVSGQANQPTLLKVLTDDGRVYQSSELPVSGRLTGARILPRTDFGVRAIGLCLDVTSPCARSGEARGPFNTLLTAAGRDTYRVLLRHIKGHLNFTTSPKQELIVASSNDEMTTDLVCRDASDKTVWQVTVPGRLSAGPQIGPSDEIYLATCSGWPCRAPHLLFSVTGRPPTEAE